MVKELMKAIGNAHVPGIVRTPEKASHLKIEVRKGDF
jgi:NAD(P)H dehydrogenase (quinone)